MFRQSGLLLEDLRRRDLNRTIYNKPEASDVLVPWYCSPMESVGRSVGGSAGANCWELTVHRTSSPKRTFSR